MGALAVALGVGVAVASSHGVPLAHAEDTEQAPTDQQGDGAPEGVPGEPVSPGDGGSNGAPSGERPDAPTVTVNGEVVEGGGRGGTNAVDTGGAAPTVPKMNFAAQGVENAKEGAKGKDVNVTNVDTPPVADPTPVDPTPVDSPPVDPPVEENPPIDVVEPDPPSTPDTPSTPEGKNPKAPAGEDVNPPAGQSNSSPVNKTGTNLNVDSGTVGTFDNARVEFLDPVDNSGVHVDTGNRIAMFSTIDFSASQGVSTLIAPSPNIIEPEQPNLLAGLAALPGVVVRLVATVFAAALAPFVQITGPIAPPQPPTLWALLAWVRREFERTLQNQTPHAVDDSSVSTDEGQAVDITAVGNDTDSDDDPLTVTDFTQPENGSVTYDPTTKTFTYTPNTGFSGDDTFEYAVSDEGGLPHWHGIVGGLFNLGHQDVATVTVTVTSVDDPLQAVDDEDFTDEDTPVGGNVLENDVDDDPLTVSTPGLVIGTHGVLSLKADGTYAYTPGGVITLDPDQATAGTVDYDWVGDNPGTRNYIATTFTAGHTGSYDFGQPGGDTDTIIAVYAGDFDDEDPDADLIGYNDDTVPVENLKPTLTVDLVEGQQYTVVISTWDTDIPLDLTLTVAATATGDPANALQFGEDAEDTFSYTVTNGTDTDTATLTVTVNGVDDPLQAVDDEDFTDEDTPVGGNVLDNDVDPDDPLTVSTPGLVIGTYGVLSLKADGTYAYTPGGVITLDPDQATAGTVDYDWTGYGVAGQRNYVEVTFTAGASGDYDFGLDDDTVDTVIAVYNGDFNPEDPEADLIDFDDDSGPGLAPRMTATLVEGQQYTVVISAYEVGEPLDLTQTFYATAAGDPANALQFGEDAEDTFAYSVSNGYETDTTTITVTVYGVNDAPVIVDVDTDSDAATGIVEGTVFATDVDGGPLIYTASNGAHGTVSIDPATGAFVYTPNKILAVIPGSDFESGDLSGWSTGGQPGTPGPVINREGTGSTVTTGPLTFDPTEVNDPNAPPDLVLSDWVFTPAGNHAAALSPNGSQTFAQAGLALGLTTEQQQQIITTSIDTENPGGPQDAAWVTRVVHLEAGTTYTMSWNYVSTDYEPFNDGSITTLVSVDDPTATVYVNGYESNYAILGFTNEGTGDYSTTSFSSTGWQTSTYEVTQTGEYRVGFAVFNLRDQLFDPVLLLDSEPGTTTRDGQAYNPVPPNNPTAPRTIDDTFTVTVDDGVDDDEIDVTVLVTIVGALQV